MTDTTAVTADGTTAPAKCVRHGGEKYYVESCPDCASERAERQKAERAQFVAGLRELADWYEQHPEIDPSTGERHLIYCTTREQLAVAARALGRADKHQDDNWFFVTRKFGSITVEAYTDRGKVCRKVVTGTRVVPAQVIPGRTEPERVEEIVEWVCDESILASLPTEREEA